MENIIPDHMMCKFVVVVNIKGIFRICHIHILKKDILQVFKSLRILNINNEMVTVHAPVT